jgi:hypothetical protein
MIRNILLLLLALPLAACGLAETAATGAAGAASEVEAAKQAQQTEQRMQQQVEAATQQDAKQRQAGEDANN